MLRSVNRTSRGVIYCLCIYIILYYIILYYILLYYIIFYYILLYFIILYYIVLYYIVWYYIIIFYLYICLYIYLYNESCIYIYMVYPDNPVTIPNIFFCGEEDVNWCCCSGDWVYILAVSVISIPFGPRNVPHVLDSTFPSGIKKQSWRFGVGLNLVSFVFYRVKDGDLANTSG